MFSQNKVNKEAAIIVSPEVVEAINFVIGDNVVYPTHGVGVITSEEQQVVAGVEMPVYVISFLQDKMTLRVPKTRAAKAGLRPLSTLSEVDFAIKVLRNRTKSSKSVKARIMWSKRARKYEAMINSGSMVLLAEVIRDLYKAENEERSYSEKQIYDTAISRFVQEYSIVKNLDRVEAAQAVLAVLSYS